MPTDSFDEMGPDELALLERLAREFIEKIDAGYVDIAVAWWDLDEDICVLVWESEGGIALLRELLDSAKDSASVAGLVCMNECREGSLVAAYLEQILNQWKESEK